MLNEMKLLEGKKGLAVGGLIVRLWLLKYRISMGV